MNTDRPLAETDPVWEAIISGKIPLRMDPNEESWASWKNEGGPHHEVHSHGPATILRNKPGADIVRRVVIPYDGTETVCSAPVPSHASSTFMANMMA